MKTINMSIQKIPLLSIKQSSHHNSDFWASRA